MTLHGHYMTPMFMFHSIHCLMYRIEFAIAMFQKMPVAARCLLDLAVAVVAIDDPSCWDLCSQKAMKQKGKQFRNVHNI